MNNNFFSNRKNFEMATHVLVLAMAAISMVLLITPQTTMGAETGDVCIDHYQPRSRCTANDVTILSIKRVGPTPTCSGGGIAEGDFDVTVGTTTSRLRYDVGIFMAQDGGSALTGTSCYHDFLNPVTSDPASVDLTGGVGPYLSLDGDQCGDIVNGTQPVKTVHLTFACVDLNGDGFVDISSCASWDNQASNNCASVADAFPSTKSKCSCGIVATDIPIGAPDISVTKTPATQTVISGQPATFTITVINSGNTPLSNIIVSDPQCSTLTYISGDTNSNSILETTETWTYTCTVNNVTSPFTNTVQVTGTPPNLPNVTASATADVTVNTPLISVIKSPSLQTVESGGTATFTITVTNPGSVTLGNIQVIDTLCSTLTGPVGDTGSDGILPTTETWTYTCMVNNVTSDFINSVTVSGTVPGGPTVSDHDEAEVAIPAPVTPVTPVPTLTEWGMILFMLIAGMGSFYYLRRSKRV